jgi:glycosyltransferase involved in cell wall biosynthesis
MAARPPAVSQRSPTAARQDAPRSAAEQLDLSVVVPVHDEEGNIGALYEALTTALASLGRSYEIIVVDDGSRDETYARLAQLAEADSALKLIKLRRNYGQTAAMAAGFDHAVGDVVISMDGDLQNDPADIARLLSKLDEGYDVVSGWRKDRHDGAVRRLPSRVANWLIGHVTGVRLHDYGCTLKAYRADVIAETRLYGEMHRFLPALAHQAGAEIAEIPVVHHARTSGRSKYGLGRTFKVLLDLMTVKFLSVGSTKPSYVFGGSGLVLCFLGSLFILWTAYQRLVNEVFVYRQPSLLVGVFLFTIGINLFLLGLLAELVVRTYHESQSKPTYLIREQRNFEEQAPLS